jgi:hypothetical protein
MSEDSKDNELIERYLLGKLSTTEVRALKERIDDDREFRRKVRLISTFPEMMSPEAKKEYDAMNAPSEEQKSEPEKSFSFPKPTRTFWVITLCVCAAAIVVGYFTLFYTPREPVKKPVQPVLKEEVKPVVPQPKKEEKKVDSAVIVKPVEPTKEAIELVRPTDGTVFSRTDEIVFQWIQATDTFTRLYVHSVTSDKLILWRGIRPGIREFRLPGTTFYPGTFYWFVGRYDTRRTFTVTP